MPGQNIFITFLSFCSFFIAVVVVVVIVASAAATPSSTPSLALSRRSAVASVSLFFLVKCVFVAVVVVVAFSHFVFLVKSLFCVNYSQRFCGKTTLKQRSI